MTIETSTVATQEEQAAPAQRQLEMSPTQVAGQAMEMADYDRREAAEIMEEWVRNDRALWDAIAEQFLSQAVWYFLRGWDSSLRRRMRSLGKSQDADSTEGVTAVSNRNWYKYPLPGGKRLGDATVQDLIEAVSFYEQQARQSEREADRLRKVVNLMPPTSKKSVREKISHDKLDEAMQSVVE